ncbi:MAG TPA: LPD38 domain-containing protein [Desulfosporosinus sp.]|nr:LPD38 domain-containing protein [Desulfosporosinus sp.]
MTKFDFGHADGKRFGQASWIKDPGEYESPQSVTVLPDIQSLPVAQSTWDKVKAFDFSGLARDFGTIGDFGTNFMQGGMRNAAEGYRQDGLNTLYALQQETLEQEKRKGITPSVGNNVSFFNPSANSLDIKNSFNALQSRVPIQPTNTAGQLGNMAGEIVGSAPAFAFGGAATEGIAQGLLGKMAPKIAPKLLPYAERSVKDSLSFAPIGLMESNKLSEIPSNVASNALTGAVLGPAFLGIGQGLKLGKDVARNGGSLKEALAERKLVFPELESNPLKDAQNAFIGPTLRDFKAQQLNNTFLGPQEITSTKPQLPFSPTPLKDLRFSPLQQNMNNAIGIKNPLSPLERSQRQGDLSGVFKNLPNRNTYSLTTGEQRALSDLQEGINTAQNYIGHNDVLAGFPPGTSIEQAYQAIAKNTGVDLPKLMGNWERAQAARTSLTPKELGLGRVAGVIPKLKPRELKPLATNPFEVPAQRVLPKPLAPQTWTNKDGILQNTQPLPIRSINKDNLGLLPKSQPIQPKNNLGPLLPQRIDRNPQSPGTPSLRLSPLEQSQLPLGQGKINPLLRSKLASPLPEPQSKIIIGKSKDPFSFSNAWDKFYTGVVNTQQPIANAAKITESDMGKLASNTKNVSGIVDHNFLKAMVDKDGNKVGESLKSTVETIPKGQEEEFWTYMSQRHNVDRAREESHQVPKVDKQGFLIKDKDRNQVYETVVTKKSTPVQANYTPNMSAQAVRNAEQAHPEYKAIGDGITRWIDDFMQTWGVDTGIVDKDIYKGLRETYKSYFPTQRDFSALEKAIPDNVSQKFSDQRTPIRKATGSERDIIDPIENIMQLVNRTIRTAKYNEVGQSLLTAVKENPAKMKQFAEVISTKDGIFTNTDNVISVLVNGKPTYLQINDKMLLDSMNGLPKSIGNIPVLSTLTNGFKGLITQKNPLFAIRNIFRDVPTAYVYGSESNPLKYGAGLLGAGKDILTNGPRLQKYQAVGGGGANFFNSGDVTKSATELMGNGSKLKSALTAPIHAIEKFNNLTETAPRLAEFNRVFDKTGDVTKALYAANDVSVNFSRSGNLTKNIDKGVPYLNAGVQGLDKFFRGFANPKTALATIVKSGVAITAPDLALYMVNKDDPNYQALDNRTKDSNFLIPKGDGTFIKIPKSRELGVLFGSLFERSLRMAEGQKDAFKGFGNTVATNFSPANPIDSNFFAPATWNLATNKDFADRAIVPQGMLMDKRSKYLQYDEKTTLIAKAIGEMSSNVIPGGISPKQLDYLVKSYSGVIGQFGTPLVTSGGSPGKTLTSQFVADPAFSNQSSTDFYDKLDKLSAAAVDKNVLQKLPSKILSPEEDMRNSMNAVSAALSRGTKIINTIQASADPSKDDKIKAIKLQMLDLTRRSNSANDSKTMQAVENSSKNMFK